MTGMIRKAAHAGSWYPGNPADLNQDIHKYLSQAALPDGITGSPLVLISPHAGYMYSGPVAAYAYKTVASKNIKRVVVISPSHRAYFPFVALWNDGGFETPLGVIPVDTSFGGQLIQACPIVQADTRPHMNEHALEIQLPFLQSVLSEFSLCPLIMGQQDLQTCTQLAQALHSCISDPEETLVVASSDLSHFHQYQKATVMDNKVARLVESFDIEGLASALAAEATEACGGGPIMTAMLYARLKNHTVAHVLKYANSGDVTGDRSSVVGYMAAAIY